MRGHDQPTVGAGRVREALLGHVAAGWPSFAALRAAASSGQKKSRLANELSAAVNELRVTLAACFLSESTGRTSGPLTAADARQAAELKLAAEERLAEVRAIAADGRDLLRNLWYFSDSQADLVVNQFGAVAGVPGRPAEERAPLSSPVSPPRAQTEPFGQASDIFLALVARGWSLDAALRACSSLRSGAFAYDDRSFYPDDPALGPLGIRPDVLQRAERVVVGQHIGGVTLFVVGGLVAAVCAKQPLRVAWLEDIRRAAGGLESLPDFIALPRDEEGRPIIPATRVTALMEAQEAWACELGPLDGVTNAIVHGKLVMPRISAPSQRTALRNHPSWEEDEDAKRALGPVIAKWLATGVLEYVGWNDRLPILLQPCGAVPKGTAPFYRLITDARFANSMYADWGVSYTTAAQLSSTLNRCDFTFSIDISDAYHLSLWAGCGGELRSTRRPVLSTRDGPEGDAGRLSWLDAKVNGCDPSNCRGGCDKDLSGIVIDGHVFRFASCQFGQKTAGSPLGAIVRSVARYFARLPSPVHVAAWVDDLIFIMSTPDHGICAGHEGGCAVCAEYYGRALLVQQQWRAKAARLNIPLSGKGHEVAQRGSYTGVGIDTFRGLYLMLPDKTKTLRAAVVSLLGEAEATPRLIAVVRGKAIHYGCAIAFIRMAAASLSQAMYGAESGAGPASVPSLREEQSREFAWDARVRISPRAQRALEFMKRAIDGYTKRGQPIWRIVPISLYTAFCEGRLGSVRVLAITYDASVHGWGAVVRTSHREAGWVLIGGFREAMPLLGAAFLDPAALGDTPEAQILRETLAGLLVVRAVSRRFALNAFTVIVRGDCLGALAALRKGSFRSPALQDVALSFADEFIAAGADPPLFLHAPGRVLKAEGVDDLSRGVAAARRAAEATCRLRGIVQDEAARFGDSVSIDLFATAENALVPRFFARHAEPLAEGVDALVQPDWGRSWCARCQTWHRETVYAFPPLELIPRVLAKARVDGLRGVVILPFVTSHTAWQAFAAASLTSVQGQRDPCVKVPVSAAFVTNADGLRGTQKLAVLAVDFSRASGRSFDDTSPACGSFADFRPFRRVESAQDEDDRRRIAVELERAGLTDRTPAPPAAVKRQRK